MKVSKLIFGIVFVVILTLCAGSKGGKKKPPTGSGKSPTGSGKGSGNSNAPSYGWKQPTSGQSTGGYNPPSGGTHNNPYNGGNNPSYGWKQPTSGQSTGGYNPPSGGTHNSQPYNPHSSPTQNFGSPPPYNSHVGHSSFPGTYNNPYSGTHNSQPYNPYVGHSPFPGVHYNPPVGHIPTTTFVQTSGQSYSQPGLGQMAKEAFVFAGVNAGVQSIVNRILPGGISGQRHDSSPNSGASRSVVAPTSTNNTIVYNNYYYNNGSAGEQKPTEQKPAVEQKSSVPTFIPLNESQITKFTEDLFAKDKNNAFKHVRMNLQGQKTDDSVTDIASETFLTVENMIYGTPTIKSVLNLYDNYEVNAEVKENITESREKKENDLLDQFIQTDVMKATIEFLSKNGYIVEKNFKADLRTMWFTLFPRTDKGSGSSGFETVFLAEIISNETIGMHNWIYYAKQETAKKLNYLGYIHEKKLGSNGAIVKLRSILDGAIQPVTTIFVGTSPELEMALYTMCYYVRPNYPCLIELGGAKFEIIVNAITYETKGIIVSAYPEI